MAARSVSQDDEPFLKAGTVVDDQYKVSKRLGKGGYGEIYLVESLKTGEQLAMKCEKPTKQGSLDEEIRILRILRGSRHVPNLLDKGHLTVDNQRIDYFTMDLLGDNLSNLRRKCSNNVFSMKTTMALGMQMLAAIKFVHDAGFLHRDIKPGNFLVGREKSRLERSVIIIDFGLSRRHLTRNGQPRARRSHARWVGSRRYMSPNTHFRKDQGRRDDLWSFLYVLIEFCTGTLPWAHLRGLNNLDRVRDIKVDYMGDRLVRNLPAEFKQILDHIKSLNYADRPDYSLLHRIMKQLYESEGGAADTPFDWMLVPKASGAGDHDVAPEPAKGELPLHMSATEASIRLFQVNTASQPHDTSSDTDSDRESDQISARQIHAQQQQARDAPATTTPDKKPTPKTTTTNTPSATKPKKRRCIVM